MRIRQLELSDINHIVPLCEQFGFHVNADEIEERVKLLFQSPEHQLFVADDGGVVGWLHVQGIHTLSSPPYAEVRGIVVDRDFRQRGVGRQLMSRAENWAIENGYQIIRLRSGTQRPEAHHFYPSIGYKLINTQHHYQKILKG